MNEENLLKRCTRYLMGVDLSNLPGWSTQLPFQVKSLAQGEYNFNALLEQGHRAWVVRVNMGSQIDCGDQITYEYQTLRMLQKIGRTPAAYYVDPQAEGFEHGLLIMEYLPGRVLDYRSDSGAAARLFAEVHAQTHSLGPQHLMQEARPLSMVYAECARLLNVYFNAPLADPALCDYLRQVLHWAEAARQAERAFQADPWPCVINTEVNSGNFIFNPDRGSLHLVDWEKALWGDPSQDLSHFCVPTTTLWKTPVRFSCMARANVLNAYREAIDDAHLADTIEDRVRLRDPFNCLRGIAWSAMAFVHYQNGAHALRNADTFHTVCRYLQLPFLRSLFDRYLKQDAGRWK